MIKISDVSKSYGPQLLLDEVSFNINEGDKIGLVGRNGSGKTTLFRMLMGIEDPDDGEIAFPKDYSVGYLQQHLHFTQPTLLEEACLGLPESREYEHWRVEKILFGLGFTEEDMNRRPDEFSGGYQIRLNLAKTLVSEPDLLLLDEPTNYLDIISIRWLEKFLRDWPREFVIITHDRQFMDSVTTHTMIIHRRKVRKIEGKTLKLYEQIMQDEEVYEKTRINEEKKTKEMELFITRFRAKARLAGLVQSRVKALEKRQKLEKLDEIEDVDFKFNATPFPADEMLSASDLAFRYDAAKPWLIERLSFSLGKRERIAIIGKNGKGKSTLLKLIAGELEAQQGRIKRHPKLEVGYFGQTNILRLDTEKTIEEELLAVEPNHSRERARTIAGVMLFSGDMALKKIEVLSGGERSRVLLGKILLEPANLLLLDEPTNHLDMESCESLLEAMRSFDGSVVFVTHDEIFLDSLAERLIIFDRDRVYYYHGKYREFLEDIGWENEEGQKPSRNTTAASQPEPTPSPEPEAPGAPKKDLRQARAAIVQEKSKALRPLAQRLEKTEKMIERVEGELSRYNQKMVEASMEGNAAEIAALPKKIKELQEQTDFLYQELEKNQKEYDAHAAKYEKELQQLED